jgi:hypothetical protein
VDDNKIGYLNSLRKNHFSYMFESENNLKFNEQNGTILLKAVDGTRVDDGMGFFSYTDECVYQGLKIKNTTRHITLISGDFKGKEEVIVEMANLILEDYFRMTNRIFLSAFKGNNNEGVRRRRLDYKLARCILSEAMRRVS